MGPVTVQPQAQIVSRGLKNFLRRWLAHLARVYFNGLGSPGADSSGIATRGTGARSDPGAARLLDESPVRERWRMIRSLAVALVLVSWISSAACLAQDAASSLPKVGTDPSKLPATVPVRPFANPATDQQAAHCGAGGVQCGNGCCYAPYTCCRNDKNQCCSE